MKNVDQENVLRSMDLVSRAFLMLHMLLLFLFFMSGAYIMIVVSLVTVLVVGISFWFAKREKLRGQTLCLYSAQLVEIVFSAVCVGWTCGLLVPLLGVTLFVFFCEYVGRSLEYEYMPSQWAAIAGAVVFILVLSLGFYSDGRVPLDESVTTLLHLMWNIPMFIFSAVVVYVMIHQFSYSERVLADQAHTDRLTGLMNRAGYEQVIRSSDIRTTTLIVFDADKFKHVNDTYGHEVGDLVLQKIARTLKQNFRLCDYVCRTGGDEFVVLMMGNDELEQDQIVRKVNRINRELSHADDKIPIVSVSAGVAYGANEKNWKDLFNHADQAMYQIKQSGGRGCRFYSP